MDAGFALHDERNDFLLADLHRSDNQLQGGYDGLISSREQLFGIAPVAMDCSCYQGWQTWISAAFLNPST
jgi:hypothetical protein